MYKAPVGETFNWMGLPTELKERVIQFCMHRSVLAPLPKRFIRKHRGAREVTGHFGQWAALLGVSRQVRAISLRLCFMGSSDLTYGKGLCIIAENMVVLKQFTRHLARFSQLLEPNNASIATDDKTSMLARTYRYHPKIYPHLQQYATLSHGIRKVSLQLSFLDAMHFFKVTKAGFAQYRQPHHTDYDVFERLPNLNELRVQLPEADDNLTNHPRQHGPQIFHDEPCPRILHRLVYERAAEALAKYPFVTLHGFLDQAEELRYNTLRKEAMKGLKFSGKELQELYMEDGGGVELEESVWPVVDDKLDKEEPAIVYDDFWPPKCRCEVLCRRVV